MSHVRVGTKAGLLAAIMSNLFLGFSSLYWKALGELSSISLLGYRVFISMLCVTLILLARKELRLLLFGLELRDVALHGTAALLVACNWGVFIWSSIHGRVFETGLGYLIAPILGIGLGIVFYKENLSFFRGVIIFFIVSSVFFLIFRVPGLDFRVYLSIGVTWGMYTWLKKMARLDPISGLFVESFILTFITAALISYIDGGVGVPKGLGVFRGSLLLSCGLVSLVPLALFAFAAKHLPLSVMGLLQFLLPLTQFCIASVFYGQNFTAEIFLAFSIIFTGMVFIILEVPIKKLLSAEE
ncbi:hypothetical protein NTD86_07475 [Pseudomonas sp. 7P_10.2_Bac1]|uniref:EamA family transporter n=1 Tax=Pseudomonas sp. 7P_10.2_Bac1 TaxID=2971614 RepID=UPI0021C6897F|nr:hypothetical protein [Pseudomonas sp. 7P_10.2_Bac1]MCU1726825.1 hypothetical protein [Pseudomonas sp. 7P_10.2_Bac1]